MKMYILVVLAISCFQICNAASQQPWFSQSIRSTTMQTTTIQSASPPQSVDHCPIEELETCGYKYGFPATRKQFPFVVFLKSEDDFQVQYCSGSLIHPRWVLTSAYCVPSDVKIEVILGALVPANTRDPDRDFVEAELVIIHPEYIPHNYKPKNDIALIKLSRKVRSATINPIPLKRDPAPITEESITFAGWEQAGFETLAYTNRIMISEGPCRCRDTNNIADDGDADVDADFLCGLSVEFFCFIHNGGGLAINGALVAVMSTQCFTHCNHMEGTFTNIYKHLQWIEDTLAADLEDEPVYGSCIDIPDAISGVYLLQPNFDVQPFEAYCELRLDGEKWTVIHQRFNESIDFYRNYANYTEGFGPIDGNHWLGLEKMHQLTKYGDHELSVEITSYNSSRGYARYKKFKVDSAEAGYKLTISGYTGTAGDSMHAPGLSHWLLDGMKFTTFDKDQDKWSDNCAVKHQGAWWYNGCSASSLNGPYHDAAVAGGKTMHWEVNFGWVAIKSARMMIRRK